MVLTIELPINVNEVDAVADENLTNSPFSAQWRINLINLIKFGSKSLLREKPFLAKVPDGSLFPEQTEK